MLFLGCWVPLIHDGIEEIVVKSLPEDMTELRIIYNTTVKIAGMDEIVRLEYR